jgi:hypothetical protein
MVNINPEKAGVFGQKSPVLSILGSKVQWTIPSRSGALFQPVIPE